MNSGAQKHLHKFFELSRLGLALLLLAIISINPLEQQEKSTRADFSVSADLQVTITGNKTTSTPGDMITTTISYKNNGTNVSTGTIVKFQMPNGSMVASATIPYSQNGNILTFSMGSLASNSTGKIIVYTNVGQWVPTPQNFTFIAAITGDITDTNSSNNLNTYQVAINAGIDCSQTTGTNTGLVINYTYTDPTHDILIQSINYGGNSFPGLIFANAYHQLNPIPNQQEISTDKGDNATSTYPNLEDPTPVELLDYLGNNNLNNIIDIEGILTGRFDIQFDTPILDNNPAQDGYSELLIFERGKNSDIAIQAVNGLGGTPIGTPIFLSRNQQISLGVSIDTIEIGTPQQVGYWRVDLNQLNVSMLKNLRVVAAPGYAGPDIKIIGIKTTQCSNYEADLQLNQIVDKPVTTPGDVLTYTITYGNNGPDTAFGAYIETIIPNNLTFVSSQLSGTLSGNIFRVNIGDLPAGSGGVYVLTGLISSLAQSGDTIVTTSTIYSATPESDYTNNTATSITLIKDRELLKLTALCSPNPLISKTRKATNPNNSPISFTRIQNNNQSGTLVVPASGDLFFTTSGSAGQVTVEIFAFGKLQDTKSSNTISCPIPIADLRITHSVNQTSTQSGDLLLYTINYGNLGPDPSRGVYIDLNLGSHLTFIYSSLSGAYQSGTTYRIPIGSLPVNASGTFFMTGLVNGTGGDPVILNTTISGAVFDPYLGNNSFTTIITIGTTGGIIFIINPQGTGDSGTGTFTGIIQDKPVIKELEVNFDNKTLERDDVLGIGCHYTDEKYMGIKYLDIQSQRYSPYARFLTKNCITKGRRQDFKYFVANSGITIAETTKIFTKIRGIANNLYIKGERYLYVGDTPMADVPNRHRAANYVDFGYQLGLLDGMYKEVKGKKYLNPDKEITRAKAIKMMMITYSLINNYPIVDQPLFKSKFVDIDNYPEEKKYIIAAELLGFINGTKVDNIYKINGNQPILRSEMSKIVAVPFKNVLRLFLVDIGMR